MAIQGGSSAGSGDAGSIRSGRAHVELWADTTALSRALGVASTKISQFSARVRNIGLGISGLGAAILAPVLTAAQAALTRGDAAKKASDRLGITAEAYTALGHAASMSGVDIEKFNKALDKFRTRVEGPLDAALAQLADRIAATSDPLRRAELAVDAFGESGVRLLPLLQGGAAGLQDLMREADRVGEVVTGANAAAAERIGDSITRAWRSAKNTILAVGEALFPQADAIEIVSSTLVNAARSVRLYINENQQLVQTAVAVGGSLVAAGAAIGGLSLALTVGAATLSGLSVGVAALGAALGAILSPIGLTATAAAAFFTLTETGRTQLGALVDYFAAVFEPSIESLKLTWQGLSDALQAGDLQLAAEVAMAGLAVEFARGKLELVKIWESLALEIKNIWYELIGSAQLKFDQFTTLLAKGLNNLRYQIGLIDYETGKAINDALSRDIVDADRAKDQADQQAAAARRQEMAAAVAAARADLQAAERRLQALADRSRRQAVADAAAPGGPLIPSAQLARQATTASGVFATFGRAAQMFGGDQLIELTAEQNRLLAQIRDRVGVPRFQ